VELEEGRAWLLPSSTYEPNGPSQVVGVLRKRLAQPERGEPLDHESCHAGLSAPTRGLRSRHALRGPRTRQRPEEVRLL